MKKVYAIFSNEIYEIYDDTDELTGYTALSYDELMELCDEMMFELTGISGMDDDD